MINTNDQIKQETAELEVIDVGDSEHYDSVYITPEDEEEIVNNLSIIL